MGTLPGRGCPLARLHTCRTPSPARPISPNIVGFEAFLTPKYPGQAPPPLRSPLPSSCPPAHHSRQLCPGLHWLPGPLPFQHSPSHLLPKCSRVSGKVRAESGRGPPQPQQGPEPALPAFPSARTTQSWKPTGLFLIHFRDQVHTCPPTAIMKDPSHTPLQEWVCGIQMMATKAAPHMAFSMLKSQT